MFYRKILEDLEEWKHSSIRKPLVIRGARQVGKTTVVNEFSKQFKQYIAINLEQNTYRELFSTYTDIHQITERLFFAEGKQLALIKETLLFIDEIQEVPKAINILRYFKEELPELAVIAAGSMLETLLGKNISFPVGRIEYRILRPVSFEEFLKAMGEEMALEEFRKVPLKAYAHTKLLSLFHTYALIGGMPEVVAHYAQHRDITALKPIYLNLLNSYLEDAEKYAKSETQLQLIRFVINQVIHHAGKRIKFQGFGNSNYKSKEISETLRTLQKTHLLHLIYPSTSYDIPLQEDFKKAPRLQFLDSGLMNFQVGLQTEILRTSDLNSVYQGTLIEHLVGQELLAHQFLPLEQLHYWVREKNSSMAELDYVYPINGKVVPIEVKSGSAGKIKSLTQFIDSSTINFGIRFFAGEFSINELETPLGKKFYLLNLPYYLAGQTEQYIKWMNEYVRTNDSSDIVQDPKVKYERKKPISVKKEITTIEELTEKHLRVLTYCQKEPQTAKNILEDLLGLTEQTRNKRIYIKPLLDLELLEFTEKENIKSRNQAYRLTEKGRVLI